jgi:hypothetical protein
VLALRIFHGKPSSEPSSFVLDGHASWWFARGPLDAVDRYEGHRNLCRKTCNRMRLLR